MTGQTVQSREPKKPTQLSASSWRSVLRRAAREFQDDNLTDWAAALTYYGVLALFPGMLVVVSLLGLLGESTTQSLLANVGQIAPGGVKDFFNKVLTNAQSQRRTAGLAAIFGLVVAVWSASGYIGAFMRAANAVYDVPEGRPVWKKIPTRLGVTLAALVMMLASAVIVLVSGRIADQVGKVLGVGHAAVTAWNIAKWPVLLIIVSLLLALLYWACPNAKQSGFRWITPGGVVAVVIWLIASGLFAVYVANFASYNKTYGVFAGVIIFLVWLWVSNIAVLLGAEFDAEMERERALLAGVHDDAQPYLELRDTRKLDPDQVEQVEAVQKQRRNSDDEQRAGSAE
jgi:membrane protein